MNLGSLDDSGKKDSKALKEEGMSSKSDGGIKYIQILFYYVQDAFLFKVHLPTDAQQGENIFVKYLNFLLKSWSLSM